MRRQPAISLLLVVVALCLHAPAEATVLTQLFDDEFSFFSSLPGPFQTFGFEVDEGFPPPGGFVGPFDGIFFDGVIGLDPSNPVPNQVLFPDQALFSSPDPVFPGEFLPITIDFSGLPESDRPIGFGFFGVQFENLLIQAIFSDGYIYDGLANGGLPPINGIGFPF